MAAGTMVQKSAYPEASAPHPDGGFQPTFETHQLGALYAAELAPLLDDFSATAFAAERLDLIFSVDTALAYLAGSLGRPVWLLLPHAPEWCWQLGRDDSPWYPTMRLFRQTRPGDWDGVFGRVSQVLETL